ncbi:hypothetical protein DS2_19221 [Catenovulum agarivorans DS-2]|uniref:Uncharacterized protein n=1 Tax=Catenovulum agarivorans DS-2 TaxID=1328313 RepID=W7QIW5_9ALTE|nr:hypothetical protein [Catenovulum agarivorans]EWH08073.1 hypothetical protein DS2_19221 [Catenovulum agarivorans DS-2]
MTKRNKERFSISISPECYDALERFTKLTGATKSGFIDDVLKTQVDNLNLLCDSIEEALKGNEEKALENVGSVLADMSRLIKEKNQELTDVQIKDK